MMATSGPALQLVDISKSYGETQAVRGVNIDIAAGEFFALLGPSGCGKTSTLRMVAGLIRPTSGEVFIKGVRVTGIPPSRRGIAMVFQSYALFPHMTVEENVAFGLEMRNAAKREIREAVARVLAIVRLEGYGRRYPRELSGGEQQRVALARAAAIDPAVLLLDEPLGALDRRLRDEMQVELRELQRKLNVATIMVTHDQDEALTLSDRIAVMHRGEIRQIGRPIEIYERPVDSFVANFIGVSNLLAGEVVATRPGRAVVRTPGGAVIDAATAAERAVGTAVVVAIRPERIHLSRDLQQPGYDGVVEHSIYVGRHISFHARLATGERLIVTEQSRDGALGALPDGSKVRLSWSTQDAQALGA